MSVSRPNRRQQRKAETRSKLRDAARRCFETHGYAATTVGRISAAAGVAHGTFYVHFANKDAVLDELLDAFNEDFLTRLAPAFDDAADDAPLEILARRVARVLLEAWARQRALIRCLAERSSGGPTLEQLRDGVNPPLARRLEEVLGRRAAAEGAPARDWRLVTHALLAAWLRIGLQVLFGSGVSRDEAETVLTQFTAGALRSLLRPPSGRASRAQS